MAKRLINLFIKNVAAVDRPANRRSFLVIKAEGDAITFDEAMLGRRMYKIYMALSEHYGALMETLDSVRSSEEANKGAAIKAALTAYLGSVQKSLPGMLGDLESDDMEKGTLDSTPLVKVRDKLTMMIKEMTMSEVKKDPAGLPIVTSKAPDVSALQKLGQGIAALFGRATGADDATIAELEKVEEPVIPIEVTMRLSKAETENAELKTRLEKAEQATAALRDEQALRVFAEEVAGYKDIGLNPATDAVLLKAVTEKLPKEQSDRIREIFKSIAAQAKVGELFKEIGSSGAGQAADSAAALIEQKAAALVQKNEKLTLEQARDSVFRSEPGLYERWRRETTVNV